MAPSEDSDLRTFKSSLRQEAQPDFTIHVGDSHAWTVHSSKLLKSSFFQKICGAEAVRRDVTLHDDDPLMIGYLILWLYTGDYTDPNANTKDEEEDVPPRGLDIKVIMNNGKAAMKSPELGSRSPSLFVPDGDSFETPTALHAKMYVLGEKYGIAELVGVAVEELNVELTWNDNTYLPSLEYLFMERTSSQDPNTPAAVSMPTKDSEIFELLAATACTGIGGYLTHPTFQKVLKENPAFQFEVLTRVAGELVDTKDKLAKLTESIEGPKVKKGRKKRPASQSLEKEGA